MFEGEEVLRLYSTKEFGALLLVSCVVGATVVGFTIWGIDTLFPIGIPKVYSQIANKQTLERQAMGRMGLPMPYPWAEINHTLIILNDTVIESTLNVTAVLELGREGAYAPSTVNFTVIVEFSLGSSDALSPTLIDGNLSWSGEDLPVNQTRILKAILALDKGDGIYCIGGGTRWIRYFQTLGGDISHSMEGYGTAYWIIVEDERIVKVMDYLEYVDWLNARPPAESRHVAPVNVSCTWAQDNSYVDIKMTNVKTSNIALRRVKRVQPEVPGMFPIDFTSNMTRTTLAPGETTVIRVTANFVSKTKYTLWIVFDYMEFHEIQFTVSITAP